MSNIKYVPTQHGGLNGPGFCKKLGVHPELIDAVLAAGGIIRLTAKALTVEAAYGDPKQALTVGFTVDTLMKFNAGTLGSDTQESFLANVTNVLNHFLNNASKKYQPESEDNKNKFFYLHNQLFAQNEKIPLVKLYREVFGVGLKEAKDAIEAQFAKLGVISVGDIPPSKEYFFAQHGHLLAEGKKIALIKQYREVFGASLRKPRTRSRPTSRLLCRGRLC